MNKRDTGRHHGQQTAAAAAVPVAGRHRARGADCGGVLQAAEAERALRPVRAVGGGDEAVGAHAATAEEVVARPAAGAAGRGRGAAVAAAHAAL